MLDLDENKAVREERDESIITYLTEFLRKSS